MKRTCEIVPGCPVVTPASKFGCSKHWYMVPVSIRRMVNRTWCARLAGDPVEPHEAAKAKAQAAVAEKLARATP